MHVPLRTVCHRSTEEAIWRIPAISEAKSVTKSTHACSAIGSVDSQLELPFSDDRFIALRILFRNLYFKSAAICD